MDWSRYRFRSVWPIAAPPEAVYDLLQRPHEYPSWWPQVREVRRTGETTGALRMRSLLPYDLLVTAHQTLRDPRARVLEAALRGDLEGWVRWTAAAEGAGGGTRLLFEEDVVVNKPLLRRLAVPCRPLLRANHALMMRRGRRGMTVRLRAGGVPGREGV
ncbi:SRPBCC family protein [Streptomyces sp. ME19-03-3]|nr:SRPBCC family protein [Streptomyces sp. ME19-03-3]